MTENEEAFSAEFQRLKENLDKVYDKLKFSVESLSKVVQIRDKRRLLEMVDQMAKCIMYPVNEKIAFITFKIVEETIKRAVVKAEIEEYMPVPSV